MMKRFSALFLTCLFTLAACGQPMAASGISTEPQPGVPKGWITDFEAGLVMAREQGRPLLVKFTGSDWCPPCIRMHEQVDSQPAFIDYAAANLVTVYIDYPRGKPQTEALEEQNRALGERFGISGVPSVVILNPQGELIEKFGYGGENAEDFVARLAAVTD